MRSSSPECGGPAVRCRQEAGDRHVRRPVPVAVKRPEPDGGRLPVGQRAVQVAVVDGAGPVPWKPKEVPAPAAREPL
ncbi:hypothetical protein GCM10025331_54640 [Actinoplanes utahensis]